MTTIPGSASITCPACGEHLDIPIARRADQDDRSLVLVGADLDGVLAHVRGHEGQAGDAG